MRQGSFDADARIVHQTIDRPVVFAQFLHQARNAFKIRQVEWYELNASRLQCPACINSREFRAFVPCDCDRPIALFRELARDPQAQSSAASGDNYITHGVE